MSDEAVVRIVLDDKGGANPPPTSQPAPTPTPARSRDDQSKDAGAYLRGEVMPWAPPGQPIPAPVMHGMRADQAEYLRLEAEAARAGKSVKDYKKAEVDAKLSGGNAIPTAPPTPPPPAIDLHEERRKFNEERARKQASNAPPPVSPAPLVSVPPPVAPPKPTPPVPPPITTGPPPPSLPAAPAVPPPPVVTPPTATAPPATPAPTDQAAELPDDSGTGISDPTTFASPRTLERLAREAKQKEYLELAKKRVEREETLAAIDAEYAKLKPPPSPKPDPPFDPVALAKKRVDAENQRAAVDAEYAKLKPKSQKSTFDAILETAEDFRGIIGGTFGRVAGVALDIASRLRDARNRATTDVPQPTAEVAPPIPSAIPAPGGGTPGPVATMAPPIPAAAPTGGAGGIQSAVAATSQLAGASSSAALSMASIVPVAGAVAVGFMAVVGAFNAAVAEINKMADKAGEYSPEVAQAQAMAEIRAMMGDMRRARENGKELAEFVRAQSEMQQRYEDLKVAIMSKIIPVVTGIMEVLSSLLGIASQTDVEEKDDPTFAILGGKVGGLGSDEMIPRF